MTHRLGEIYLSEIFPETESLSIVCVLRASTVFEKKLNHVCAGVQHVCISQKRRIPVSNARNATASSRLAKHA